MSKPNTSNRRNQFRQFGPPLFGKNIIISTILISACAGVMLFADSYSGDRGNENQLILEEALGVAHDELIMLVIAVIVSIEIAVNYKSLYRLPYMKLFLCSYAAFALSAFFTVAEGYLLETVLNYCEHLMYMTATVLLAVWCGKVFRFRKPEGRR